MKARTSTGGTKLTDEVSAHVAWKTVIILARAKYRLRIKTTVTRLNSWNHTSSISSLMVRMQSKIVKAVSHKNVDQDLGVDARTCWSNNCADRDGPVCEL